MSKQFKMNEDSTEAVEEDLKPQEVKIEELSKEDLVRLCNDKDIELNNYKTILDQMSLQVKEIRDAYNADMPYMSTILSNTLKVQRKKEDAVKNIISGALELLVIEREEIAPERKETN